MNTRALRRIWWIGLIFLLPWPLSGVGEAFAPAARYLVLGAAGLAFAAQEGAAGPVGLIIAVFIGWGVVTAALDWLLAWAIARLLALLPSRVAVGVTLACLGGGLLAAIAFAPYRTPLGRAPRGGLLEILS